MKIDGLRTKGVKLLAFAIAMLMVSSIGVEFLVIGLVLGAVYAAYALGPFSVLASRQRRKTGASTNLVMLAVGALGVCAVVMVISALPGPAPVAGADDSGALAAATYKGVDYCKTCHGPGGFGGDQYTGWSETGHGSDFTMKEYHGDHINLYTRSGGSCQKCHVVGYNLTDIGGWDPAQAWDSEYNSKLQGIQCENCHGPGSEHSGGTTGVIAAPTVNESCNGDGGSLCHGPGGHDGPAAGTTAWYNSGHSPKEEMEAEEEEHYMNTYCAKCHSPSQYDPTATNSSSSEDIPKEEYVGVACYDCHDMHGDEHEAQLKVSKEETCVRCHTTDKAAATPGKSPGHRSQNEIFLGIQGAGVTGTIGMPGVTCVDCHMWYTPSPTRGVYLSSYTGYPMNSDHAMNPTAEACADCHSDVLSDMPAFRRPDNGVGANATNWTAWENWLPNWESEVEMWEKTIHDWQAETEPLLAAATENASLAKAAIDSAKANKTKDAATIDKATALWGDAYWNYRLVNADGSMGVHNHDFTLALLRDAISKSQQALELINANSAPVADAGPSQAVNTNQAVTFDASASSDMDGTIASYLWDFGDGATSTDMVATHSYTNNGIYYVKLTVTDDDGAAATAMMNVFVNNMPPLAAAGADQSVALGTAVSLNGSGSTDSDGTIASYAWDFGDGNSGTGAEVTHTYERAGAYAVILKVTDDDGNIGIDTLVVTVEKEVSVDLTPVENNLTALKNETAGLKTDLDKTASSVNSVKNDTANLRKDVTDAKDTADSVSGNLGMYMAIVLIIAIVAALALYMMSGSRTAALKKEIDALKSQGRKGDGE